MNRKISQIATHIFRPLKWNTAFTEVMTLNELKPFEADYYTADGRYVGRCQILCTPENGSRVKMLPVQNATQTNLTKKNR